MRAVILAGGKGTRMGDATSQLPKPMLKVGGRPILEHQINLLKQAGIKEITLVTGYLSQVIEQHFGDGADFGVAIEYFVEQTPLGTTGAIARMGERLTGDFFLLYGDVMVNMDLARMLRFHRDRGAFATLAVHPNDHPFDSDLVEMDDGLRINAFYAKPHRNDRFYPNLVNAALTLLTPDIIRHIKADAREDFGRDVFPRIFRQERLYGYRTAEYLKDVGTPSRLDEVNEDYRTRKIQRCHASMPRKAIFLDRDGVINRHVGLVRRHEDFELLPEVASAIKLVNQSEYLAVLVTNQPVVAKGLCTLEELNVIHQKLETILGSKGAKLDATYFCPHHPERGFEGENLKFKIPCDCRKPAIGMLTRASEDFNIDLNHSFIIGDSSRDIRCGINAGVKTVALLGGEGFDETSAKPDFVFPSLFAAVQFILSK